MSLLVCVYISPKAGHMLVRFDFPVCIYILALIWIGQTSWWLSYFLYVYTYIIHSYMYGCCLLSNTGARISAFGSFESNFYSRWADLDLSLELSNKYAFEKISKREKIKILRSFMNNVIYKGGSLHFGTCLIFCY